MENGYCESFNSKLRDDLLDGEIFYSLAEARIVIELAAALQHRAAPLRARLQAAGTGCHRAPNDNVKPGTTADNALDLNPDHSIGAGQVVAAQALRRALFARGGEATLFRLLARLQPLSLIALLATLMLLFGFRASKSWPSRSSQRCWP